MCLMVRNPDFHQPGSLSIPNFRPFGPGQHSCNASKRLAITTSMDGEKNGQSVYQWMITRGNPILENDTNVVF